MVGIENSSMIDDDDEDEDEVEVEKREVGKR